MAGGDKFVCTNEVLCDDASNDDGYNTKPLSECCGLVLMQLFWTVDDTSSLSSYL